MKSSRHICAPFVMMVLCATWWVGAAAQTDSGAPTSAPQTTTQRDGQHDFDPLIGKWKYHLKRRMNPLTGSNTWVDLEGTGECFKIWEGRAQLDTLEVDGSTSHIEGLTLRT